MEAKKRDGMSHSDAGKIGQVKSVVVHRERYEARMKAYLLSPNHCGQCGCLLNYESRSRKFCSKSCSAKFNNSDKKIIKKCPACQTDFAGETEYCSRDCWKNNARQQKQKRREEYIGRWMLGLENGFYDTASFKVSDYIRVHLFEANKFSCCLCKWSRVNPFTKKIPLQIHHKDGNAKNCSKDNLELLCPSCHSLTENFGSRNENSKRTHGR